jgi:hypothetical protein
VDDLKFVGTSKGNPEGQTADPATPAASRKLALGGVPLKSRYFAGDADNQCKLCAVTLIWLLLEGKKPRTDLSYLCTSATAAIAASTPPVDRHTHTRHAV